MDGRSERKEEGWSSDTVLCRGSVSKGQARSCSKLPPNAQPDVATGLFRGTEMGKSEFCMICG